MKVTYPSTRRLSRLHRNRSRIDDDEAVPILVSKPSIAVTFFLSSSSSGFKVNTRKSTNLSVLVVCCQNRYKIELYNRPMEMAVLLFRIIGVNPMLMICLVCRVAAV